MTTLTHKGYIAEISVDVDAGVLHGEVTNARATLTFSAKTVDELVPAFEDTIADYLDWCLENERPRTRAASISGSSGISNVSLVIAH